ncbi:hypothetical protein ACP275_07G103700 [Erythranthe tilingii]
MREFVRVGSDTTLRRQNDPCDLWSTLKKLTPSILMCNYFFVHQLLSLSSFSFSSHPFFFLPFLFTVLSSLRFFSLLLYSLLHQIPDYQGRNCELQLVPFSSKIQITPCLSLAKFIEQNSSSFHVFPLKFNQI